jgi:predicted  nucleic acid-binding Zn-ribbon protein
VRAYRARQRGEHEPATFEAALIELDELALAIERGRQLQAELADAVETIAELDTALQAERRRHLATQRKLERARAELDGRRAADDRRVDELRAVRADLEALRSENDRLHSERVATPRQEPAGPNRAARRQAAKRDRYTGH